MGCEHLMRKPHDNVAKMSFEWNARITHDGRPSVNIYYIDAGRVDGNRKIVSQNQATAAGQSDVEEIRFI